MVVIRHPLYLAQKFVGKDLGGAALTWPVPCSDSQRLAGTSAIWRMDRAQMLTLASSRSWHLPGNSAGATDQSDYM